MHGKQIKDNSITLNGSNGAVGNKIKIIGDWNIGENAILSNKSIAEILNNKEYVTKEYADAILNGLTPKAPVACATTSSISIQNPTNIIDDYELILYDRILVKDQIDATENGIYVYSTTGLTRASDFDEITPINEVVLGSFVDVRNGTENKYTRWVLINQNPIIISGYPSFNNAIFYQGIVDLDNRIVENKISGYEDVEITHTNVMYFDGSTTGYAYIEHNVTTIIDYVEIWYSLDNINYICYKTGDETVNGLYCVIGNVLYIGYDGTNYFNGWISRNIWKNTLNDRIVLDFTFAENNNVENINRADETDIAGMQFPLGIIDGDMLLYGDAQL